MRSFAARQGLAPSDASACWWRCAPGTFPDAWLGSSSAAPATLAPAPSLDPSPEPAPAPAAGADEPAGAGAAPAPLRVAVLGGTFNPPTHAHLMLVAQALASGRADEVWLVPCGPRADKAGVGLSCAARTALTALAVEAAFPCEPRVRTMPLELREPSALASADLFARLEHAAAARRSGSGRAVHFSLVLGMDCMGGLGAWRHPARLLADVRFLVCPRPGYERPPPGAPWPRQAAVLGGLQCLVLSSSEVRRRAAGARGGAGGGGGSGGGGGAQAAVAAALDGLVHAPVAALIANAGLYV